MARSKREHSRPNPKEVRGEKWFPCTSRLTQKKFAGESGSLRGVRSIGASHGLLFERHFDDLRWLQTFICCFVGFWGP
jgi:hypothetical protein